MHRVLLIAGALWLSIGTAASQAQPPWPDAHAAPAVQPPAPATVPDARREPLRITPRAHSADRSDPSNGGQGTRPRASPWTAFASLAAMLIVIVAAARVWKKHAPQTAGRLPAEAVEVLGRRQLDRRHAIQIVRCGSRILILGVAGEGLRTLSEISDPAEVDDIAALCRRSSRDETGGQGFLSLFRRFREEAEADAPVLRGRVDEVLAKRFSREGAGAGRSEGLARA